MLASSRRATPRPITEAERARMLEMAPTHTTHEIAAELNRSRSTIKDALHRYGVTPVAGTSGPVRPNRAAMPERVETADQDQIVALATTHTMREIAHRVGRDYETVRAVLHRLGVQPIKDKPGPKLPVWRGPSPSVVVRPPPVQPERTRPVPDLKRCPNCAGPVLGADWQEYHVCIDRPEPMGVQLAHNARPPETTPMQRSGANYRNLARGESRPWPLSVKGKRTGEGT